MARVPYVTYDDAPKEVRELYDGQLELSGRLPNFHQLLGHVPWTYRWYLGFQRSSQEGRLSPEIKRLVHIQASLANQCNYCATHNLQLANEAGISPVKISALETSDLDSSVFTTAERAALKWVASVATNKARQATAEFADLAEHFSAEEIVELTVLTAMRSFTNLIQEALWTDLEEGGLPPSTAPLDKSAAEHTRISLATYARDVLMPQLEEQQRGK